MAAPHRIAEFAIVELREPVDDAPAGARGGVLELHPGETALATAQEPPSSACALIDKIRPAADILLVIPPVASVAGCEARERGPQRFKA